MKLLPNASEELLLKSSAFPWLNKQSIMSKLEVIQYLTRHLMEHLGQVYAYTSAKSAVSVPWVGRMH